MPYRVHLDVVRVAKPCEESWDRMDGDEVVRFCGTCEKNVYRAPVLSPAAVAELVVFHEGSAEVRFALRADETIVSAEPPSCETARAACERRRKRARWKWAAVGLLLTGLAFAPFLRRFCQEEYAPPIEPPPEPITYELGGVTPQSIPGTPFLPAEALEEQLRAPALFDAPAHGFGCSFVCPIIERHLAPSCGFAGLGVRE